MVATKTKEDIRQQPFIADYAVVIYMSEKRCVKEETEITIHRKIYTTYFGYVAPIIQSHIDSNDDLAYGRVKDYHLDYVIKMYKHISLYWIQQYSINYNFHSHYNWLKQQYILYKLEV